MASLPGIVFQFHWQSTADPRDTVLVEESPMIFTYAAASAWLGTLGRHLPDEPPGRRALVCDNTSKYFKRTGRGA